MQYVRYGLIGQEEQGVLVQKNQKSFVISLDEFRLSKQEDIASLFNPITIDTIRESLPDLKNVHEKLIPLQKIRLGPPVKSPSKIIAVGRNYRDHAKEMNAEISKKPILFSKASSSIIGPIDQIRIPEFCKKPDWEVELAVIIGKKASYVNEEKASNYIAGYSLINDYSERAFQLEHKGQWLKGKSCDTFAPLGPYLLTADDMPEVTNLNIWLSVNGERKQDSNTEKMIFKVPFLVHYISQFMTLLPGDIIATGTPSGVGMSQEPPQFLKSNDIVEYGIDQLGYSRQKVVRKSFVK